MFGEVPRILATLPRWAAIEIAWKRKYVDLFSLVASATHAPKTSAIMHQRSFSGVNQVENRNTFFLCKPGVQILFAFQHF